MASPPQPVRINNTKNGTRIILAIVSLFGAGSEVKMESVGNSHFDQPEEAIEKEELKKMMVRAIDSLTEKERSVVVLYYYEDMTLKEISLTLEVSESRVSQLHTKALNKMKKILGDYVFSL